MKPKNIVIRLLALAILLLLLIVAFVAIVAVYRYAYAAIGRWAGITFLVAVIAALLLAAILTISISVEKGE